MPALYCRYHTPNAAVARIRIVRRVVAADEEIAAGQVREASILNLDMKRCVDFEKVPEAADNFRSDVVAHVLAAARVLHDG